MRRARDTSLSSSKRSGRASDQVRDRMRLAWPGRTWEPAKRRPRFVSVTMAALDAAPGTERTPGLSVDEQDGAGAARRTAVRSDVRLVHADAAALAEGLAREGFAGRVDLVYVDPPFASERDYISEARLDGPADGRVLRTKAYDDRWGAREGGVGAYLEMLAPRLEALAALLAPTGTMWVHLDWRAAYLVRVILDEVFGRDGFVNEIVWRRAPNLGRQAASGQFGRTLDTLLVYGGPEAVIVPPTRLEPIEPSAIRWDEQGRPFTSAPRGDYTDESIAKLEAEGRVHRSATGKVYIKYFLVKDGAGTWCRERRVDALWTDVAPLRHAPPSERTGYPTQKPRSLLERIVACATPPGGLVVDAFAGSGTTGSAAHALGRDVVLGDRSPVALAASRARLLREGAAVRVDTGAGRELPPAGTVRASATREEGRTVVRLVTPIEPLAWAVGQEEGGVFHRLWHAERAPGPKPVPAALEAALPAKLVRAGRGPLVVRVWNDDGSVGRVEVSA